MRLLVSWIGNTDLRAPRAENKADVGPIAQAIAARKFDRILRLTPIDLLEGDSDVQGCLVCATRFGDFAQELAARFAADPSRTELSVSGEKSSTGPSGDNTVWLVLVNVR